MKVVVTMLVDRATRSRMETELHGVAELVFAGGRPAEEVVASCEGSDCIVGSDHLRAVLAAHPSIRLVQVPWAGVDHVCDVLGEFGGVRLTNSHANAYVTAQFSVGLALALLNRLREGHEIVREGRWDERWATQAPANMSESTVGVLGAGRIGSEIARLIRPFAARVIGLRRQESAVADPPFDRIVGNDDMDWLLVETDVLFVTLPLTEHTRALIGRREMDLLGSSGYLISVGRGATVIEADLFEAVRDRRIAGAAIEVWYEYEPSVDTQGRRYPFHFPFHTLDNVLLSPHRAGWTDPAPDYWQDIIENLKRLATGKRDLLNEVDVTRGY